MSEIKIACPICQEQEKVSNLPPCKCNTCLDCLFSWIKQKNEETLYLKEQFYPCTTPKCSGEKISKDWLYSKISKDKQEILESIFLKKYFNCTPDILKCPKDNCSYAGYIGDILQTRICQEPYKCEICNHEWILNNEENHGENFFIKFYKNLKIELSETRISLISVPCIHCGRFVNKFVGCNHITCVCKKEFCYVCLSNWSDHDAFKCTNKNDAKAFGAIFCILALLGKIFFSFSIFLNTIYFVIWLIYVNVIASFTTLITFFVFHTYYKMLFDQYRYHYYISKINLKSATIILLMYTVGFFYVLKNYELIYNSYKVLFYEGCIIAALGISIFFIFQARRLYGRYVNRNIF
jgi:hypothetical protein